MSRFAEVFEDRGEHASALFTIRRQPSTGGARGTRFFPCARTVGAGRKKPIDTWIALARRNLVVEFRQATSTAGHNAQRAAI